MAAKLQFECDVCGTKKQETNHWYYSPQQSNSFTLNRWDEFVESHHVHLCGQSCVHKFLDKFLG